MRDWKWGEQKKKVLEEGEKSVHWHRTSVNRRMSHKIYDERWPMIYIIIIMNYLWMESSISSESFIDSQSLWRYEHSRLINNNSMR